MVEDEFVYIVADMSIIGIANLVLIHKYRLDSCDSSTCSMQSLLVGRRTRATFSGEEAETACVVV